MGLSNVTSGSGDSGNNSGAGGGMPNFPPSWCDPAWVPPTGAAYEAMLQRVHDAATATADTYGPTSTLVAVPAWLLIDLVDAGRTTLRAIRDIASP